MRGAPPVRMSVGAHAPWRTLCALLPALAVGVGVHWALQRVGADIGAAALAAAAGVVLLVIGLRRRACHVAHELVWDGERWTLDGEPVVPHVAIDLDLWMLLRLRQVSGRRFTWLPLAWPQAGVDRHLARAALRDARPDADGAVASDPAAHG